MYNRAHSIKKHGFNRRHTHVACISVVFKNILKGYALDTDTFAVASAPPCIYCNHIYFNIHITYTLHIHRASIGLRPIVELSPIKLPLRRTCSLRWIRFSQFVELSAWCLTPFVQRAHFAHEYCKCKLIVFSSTQGLRPRWSIVYN